jgi:hypothetical protein
VWLIAVACFIFSRFNWIEMDWNNDKTVTFTELFDSLDIDKRHIQIDNSICTEYFSLKDGLEIKIVCDEQ